MRKMASAASTTLIAQRQSVTMVASRGEPAPFCPSKGVWVMILSELWAMLSMVGWRADKMAWASHCARDFAVSCAQHAGSKGFGTGEVQVSAGSRDVVDIVLIPPAPFCCERGAGVVVAGAENDEFCPRRTASVELLLTVIPPLVR